MSISQSFYFLLVGLFFQCAYFIYVLFLKYGRKLKEGGLKKQAAKALVLMIVGALSGIIFAIGFCDQTYLVAQIFILFSSLFVCWKYGFKEQNNA